MSSTPHPAPPTEDEIHAYVDDALGAARRAEIATVLERDHALSARIEAYCADRDALRYALGGIVGQRLPPEWAATIESATRRRSFPTRRQAIAASVALIVTAGAGAALLRRNTDGILRDALAARAAGLGEIVAFDTTDVAPGNARLAAELGLHVRIPDLRHFGFQLAKLEVGAGGMLLERTAQLEYRDPASRRLTIYVRRSDGNVRFDLLRHGPDRVCVWQDDVVGAVIIAPMSAGEMMRVASGAYAALNL